MVPADRSRAIVHGPPRGGVSCCDERPGCIVVLVANNPCRAAHQHGAHGYAFILVTDRYPPFRLHP
jgi:hypothetical protein